MRHKPNCWCWNRKSPTTLHWKLLVARMLLDYGLPQDSAEMYRKILVKNKLDVDALAGLGEAELAQNDYRAAENAFKGAFARWTVTTGAGSPDEPLSRVMGGIAK